MRARKGRTRASKTGSRAAGRKTARRKTARAKTGPKAAGRKTTRRWSARVTQNSDALDLEGGVFKLKGPKRIAASLKRSAVQSRRRKSAPYRSALSMLTFYINRAGKNLPAGQLKILQQAKNELRKQFHVPDERAGRRNALKRPQPIRPSARGPSLAGRRRLLG